MGLVGVSGGDCGAADMLREVNCWPIPHSLIYPLDKAHVSIRSKSCDQGVLGVYFRDCFTSCAIRWRASTWW